MILAKIDVTKIDKAKLYVGEKGKYLDIALIETPDNRFGNDYMIVQSVTKEERLAGVKGAVLGNAKIVGARPAQQPATKTTTIMKPDAGDDDSAPAF